MDLMHHPAFADVDQDFVTGLQKTLNSISYKSDVEVIGLLMAISNDANRRNIKFTPDMQVALLEYLKSRLPVNKRGQFESLIKMLVSKH